jgi:hypothetical protein
MHDRERSYVEATARRLRDAGYQISENVSIGSSTAEGVAVVKRFEPLKLSSAWRFVILRVFDAVDADVLAAFREDCLQYVVRGTSSRVPRGLGRGMYITPVAVASHANDAVHEHIRRDIPRARLAVVQLPVLVDIRAQDQLARGDAGPGRRAVSGNAQTSSGAAR